MNRMTIGTSTLVLATLLTLAASPLLAADPEPTVTVAPKATTRQARDTMGAAINNAGLQNVFELSWRRKVSDTPDPLHRDAHVALGVSHAVTPSYARVGIWAEVAPLSVVNVRVGVEPTAYFGTFKSLMPFDRYDERFDTGARNARSGLSSAGTAARAYLSPTLRVKFGPLAAQAGADLEWWRSSANGALFYEPARDTLLASRGGGLLNTTAVLLAQRVRGDHTTSTGVLHRLTYVPAAPANRIQQVGLVAMREYQGRHFGLSRPTVAATASYYLDDPSTRHQPSATSRWRSTYCDEQGARR